MRHIYVSLKRSACPLVIHALIFVCDCMLEVPAAVAQR